MRRNLAITTAGLALAFAFCAPAVGHAETSSPADKLQGCGELKDIGNEVYGWVTEGVAPLLPSNQLLFGAFLAPNDDLLQFCNVSIPISGEFEITNEGAAGCLAINTTNEAVDQDSASACMLNGGAGYPWDRWNAISIEYHSQQLWMLQSSEYPGYCLYNDSPSNIDAYSAYWEPCNTSDHDEWFAWSGSNL
jgi:hypothetical protein